MAMQSEAGRHRLSLVLLAAVVGWTAVGCDRPPSADDTPETGAEEATAPRTVPDSQAGIPSPEELARSAASQAAMRPVRTDWSGGSPQRGAALYATNCATCHGGSGEGDGEVAPALNPKPRNFTTGVFYIDGDADAKTGEDEDLARVIEQGPGTFGGSSAMPPWGETFTDDQVRDLVAYVKSFSGSRGP